MGKLGQSEHGGTRFTGQRTEGIEKEKFLIVSLSLDLDKKEWLKACDKDTTRWKQVCDFKGWDNSIVKQQGITRLPANLLIAPNKRVVARDIRGKALIDKVKQLIEQDKEKRKPQKQPKELVKRKIKRMLVKVYGAAVQGIDATIVTIEVNSSRGIKFFLVGLPDSAVKESHERIISALQVNGYKFPTSQIVINMAPADIRKEGSSYDLPLAIGILAAAK